MAAQSFDLKARLANRSEPFLFSWMTIPSPQLAGQLARLPIEGVCLDMQHGMIGFSDAAADDSRHQQCGPARHSADPVE